MRLSRGLRSFRLRRTITNLLPSTIPPLTPLLPIHQMPSFLDKQQTIQMHPRTNMNIAKLIESSKERVQISKDIVFLCILFRNRDGGENQDQSRRREHLRRLYVHAPAAEAAIEDVDDAGHFTGGADAGLACVAETAALCWGRLVAP